MGFLNLRRNLGHIPSHGGDAHWKLVFVQRSQVSCLVTMDTSEI